MKLSQLSSNYDVVRDGEFSSLGHVDSEYSRLLAYADNIKHLNKALINPNISCLVTTPELANRASGIFGLMVAESPREAFYNVHLSWIRENRYALPFEPGIGAGCNIHSSAIVADGCRIGDDVTIGEQVVIKAPVWMGSHVTVSPGVKVGVEGILYTRTNFGPRPIPHAGYVRIHDYASLMANAIVVRSIHNSDATEIESGALIGLGSIVGHEAKVREHAIVSNQCVLARRCIIGKGAYLGTNTVIREYVSVGNNARVMAGSVVINDIEECASVSGNFAVKHNDRMLDFVRQK